MIRNLFRSSDISVSPSRKRATILLAACGYFNTGIVIVQGILLVPLYLHYIGAHTYGLWLASGGMLGMMMLMNFGISSMLIQRVSHAYGAKKPTLAGAYFLNGMVVYLVICLLFSLVGWGLSEWVGVILSVTGDQEALLRHCFQLAVMGMALGILNECLRSFSQALLRPVTPMVGMAVGRIVGIAVTVYMLFNNFALWAIPMGMLVSESVVFSVNLFYAIYLFRNLHGKADLDMKILKDYIRTSPALLAGRSGHVLSQESEPLFITMFLGPEVTTAYMISRKAADIVFNLLSQIVGSSMGTFAHLAGEADVARVSNIAYKLIGVITLLGLIGYSTYILMNNYFVSLWVGSEFLLEPAVVAFIGLGFFMRIIRSIFLQLLNGLGEFVMTSMLILLEAVVRVLLVISLFSVIGVAALPIALFISSFLTLVFFVKKIMARLLLNVEFTVVVHLVASIAVLFSLSLVASQFNYILHSWGYFVLFLGLTLLITSLAIIGGNWRAFRMIINR